jgi:heavy metal sensor kinase
MQRSIRLRLTAWYVTALAVTLLLLGAAAFLLTRLGLYHWLDETLAERAEALSEELRLVGDSKAPGVRLDLPEHGHGVYEGINDGFLILDGTGRVVIARGLEPRQFRRAAAVVTSLRGSPGVSTVSDGRGRWRVASHPILSGGKVAVVTLVSHDLKELNEVLWRLALVLGALVPLALLGAGVGGYALAGRALEPVSQITRAAAAISEQDLSRRLPVGASDELGRLATTFNYLIARLEGAFDRQRRFTADASHELRTPLSIIRAVTSQKLMRHREPEEYEEALWQIDEAAGYMAKLTAHLLVLARADAGQVTLETERLDLGELLEHVASQVEEVSRRPISVRSNRPVPIVGDPMRLTELFLNLLENATKYTPPEGSIDIEVNHQNEQATVVVRDTGVGIPEDHLPHIFERFYRVDKARARDEGGTGLGLSISRWIAKAHGGTIEAKSKPGEGTVMTVTLPAAEERR